MITEEHVTRTMAKTLAASDWEIISVHPPDGQGPFVIPKPPNSTAIERSSYHPDIVAITKNRTPRKLAIVECKIQPNDVSKDIEKLQDLTKNRDSLLFALYRCQNFESGPMHGFDFEDISKKATLDLPFEFFVASKGDQNKIMEMDDLKPFKLFYYTFTVENLLHF
jgi:hypothetical protein